MTTASDAAKKQNGISNPQRNLDVNQSPRNGGQSIVGDYDERGQRPDDEQPDEGRAVSNEMDPSPFYTASKSARMNSLKFIHKNGDGL